MLLILFSFDYIPPPEIAFVIAQFSRVALFISIVFVKKIWQGALIGGVGSFVITMTFYSLAEGVGSVIEALVNAPLHGIGGLFLGGLITFFRNCFYDSWIVDLSENDKDV